ncbi:MULTISPECIES: cytochrome C oxidase subunit IV family protein [unclassified Schlesneria]|uniref:cytochrome C oxidase subunit IV family protein n=1 Tax=Schlesneria TaxID=656899 RepID=UPI00359FFF15
MISHTRTVVGTYFRVYGMLLVLLAATVLAARYDAGPWNIAITLAIASLKAVLIGAVFMHIKQETPLVKLVITIAFFWLLIMFSLTFSDYWSRPWDPKSDPWVIPAPRFEAGAKP